MALPQHPLTLAEFLKLPEEKPALEYVDGRVRQKVAGQGRHSALQVELVEWINRAGRQDRIARAFTERRVAFAGSAHEPDVVVFRWARIPRDAKGQLADECNYPPDIAIEIISAGQTIRVLTRDCEWYVANGVALALLVLPVGARVRVFRPGQPWRELTGDDELDFSDVIPAARLRVRELFAALDAD